MGLGWLPRDRFRPLLRQWITENRQRHLESPTRIPDFTKLVFGRIQEELGDDFGENLRRWATGVFCYVTRDQPDWAAWHVALQRFTYDQRARAELPLPQPRRDELLASFGQSVDTSDIERMIKEQKQQPLSDWDLEMYALHHFNDEVGPDPFDAILATVEIRRLQDFWPELLRLLPPAEQELLWERARSTLGQLGLKRAETLARPSTMKPVEA
jgi:hypothetical protein